MTAKKRKTASDSSKSELKDQLTEFTEELEKKHKIKSEDLVGWKRPAGKRTMLSIRLTERQRELLTEAATFRDQSPTGFIKSAAMSHAAHVVNTSKKTTFDFNALAKSLARLLFTKDFEHWYLAAREPKEGEDWHPKALRLGEYQDENYAADLSDQHPYLPSTEENWIPVEPLWREGNDQILVDDKLVDEPGGKTISYPRWMDDDDPNLSSPIIRDNRDPMTTADFQELRRAVRLGGAEFLQRVLKIGARDFFRDEELVKTPEPVDPDNVD